MRQMIKNCAVNFGDNRARIGQGERVVLEKLAAIEQLSLSEMLRTLIRSEAKSRGLWPPVVEVNQSEKSKKEHLYEQSIENLRAADPVG